MNLAHRLTDVDGEGGQLGVELAGHVDQDVQVGMPAVLAVGDFDGPDGADDPEPL